MYFLKKENLVYISMFFLLFNFLFFVGLDFFSYLPELKIINRFISFILILTYVVSVSKFPVKRFYVFLTLLFFCFLFFVLNENTLILNLIYMLLFFIALEYIDKNEVFLKIFKMYFLFSCLHCFLYFFGFIDNVSYEISDRSRSTYGFTNVNQLGIFYFYCFILSFFVIFNEYTRLSKFLAYFLAVFSFYFIFISDTRTAIFCSLFYLIINFFIRFNWFEIIYSKIIVFLFSIFFTLSLFLSSKYALYLNDYLSLRPLIFNTYMNEFLSSDYNIFFGMNVLDEFPLDNSYLLFLTCFGVIVSFLFLFFSPFISFYANIEKKFFPIISSVLMYGVFESNLIRVEFLVPLVVLYILFFKNFNEVKS